MASFVAALDQGTTSSRTILFDREARIASVAQREFRQIFPRPGWVEHDPMEIWSTQAAVFEEALSSAGAGPSEIAALGITNQRETTVVWDRATGEPVHNAIVWQDRRTAEHCDRLRDAGHEELFRRKTGLVLDAYFSGTKLAWILENVDGARARAEKGELAFGTIDSWLLYKLTGGALHVTDVSNASRTLLFDVHTRAWDEELLGILGIPHQVLPEARSSSEIYGTTTAPAAAAGIPIAGILGDQQSALMGQICTSPGLAKNTYGTGCFLLMNTGTEPRPSRNKLVTTVAWERAGELQYALEGSVFVGGAVVQWLRDGLGLISHSSEIEALARSVDSSDGVVLVPALAGLGAPHWDSYARGTILGLTRGTTAAHIARAALEGIAHQVADLVSAMSADAGSGLTELRVDGGAAANDLLLQTQADLLGVPVVRPTLLETTAVGAAYMAGLATGFWGSAEELAANWQVDRRFEPQMDPAEASERNERWARAVERAGAWESGD